MGLRKQFISNALPVRAAKRAEAGAPDPQWIELRPGKPLETMGEDLRRNIDRT
jgi:hypothetical protein